MSTANNNSLYPALRRFEDAGAITRTAHEQHGRPAKLVYELTDVGQGLLHDLRADLPVDAALAGFALLTGASLGLLVIGARTPLALTALLRAVRSASIGLVISPLLAVLTERLSHRRLSDASTLFSIAQRVAGSLGVGLIAAVFAQQSAAHGAVRALHVVAVIIACIAAMGLLAPTLLPAQRNVAS